MAQIARSTPQPGSGRLRNLLHDLPLHVVLLFGIVVGLIPVLFMLNISLKSQGQFMVNPMGISEPLQWNNYVIAFNVLWRSILNSILYVVVVTAGSLLIASIAAYVFARYEFPGKDVLFWAILSILFIPGILTFATRFLVVKDLGMMNTYWGLIIPWIAGALVFQTFVLRTFFASISNEILEAARVDGASVMQIYRHIVLPMSRPILATLAILRVIDTWNEWLWPLVIINRYEVRPMALQVFYLASDVGPHIGLQMAGYTLATIPLVIVFALFTRQFIDGLSSGAVKW